MHVMMHGACMMLGANLPYQNGHANNYTLPYMELQKCIPDDVQRAHTLCTPCKSVINHALLEKVKTCYGEWYKEGQGIQNWFKID